MGKTHWKKLTNPDYLGAYALTPGQDLIATIKTVKREIVTGPEGKKEECSVCYFAESGICQRRRYTEGFTASRNGRSGVGNFTQGNSYDCGWRSEVRLI